MQQNETMIAAKAIASELVADPCPRGVARLAEALAGPHPAEQPVRLLLLELASRTGGHVPELKCEIKRDGSIRWQVSVLTQAGCALKSADTLREAFGGCLEDAKTVARRHRVKAIAERLAADEEAAEAAVNATAPLEFRPDGSPADSLPITSIGPSGLGGYCQSEVQP